MNTVSIIIDGRRVTANAGEKLLWVALDNGIYIPNLCALRDALEPAASCRLCFVRVEGKEQPVTACTEEITEGMVVDTKGALPLARAGFELLMASHPVDCARCIKNLACELQKIAKHLRVSLKPRHLRRLVRELPVDDSNPLFTYDPNKCVLCERCVWVCRHRAGSGVLGFAHRGFDRIVTTFCDEPIGIDCQDCTQCVAVCPTGALAFKNREKAPISQRCA